MPNDVYSSKLAALLSQTYTHIPCNTRTHTLDMMLTGCLLEAHVHLCACRPANSQDFAVRLKIFWVACSNMYTYKFKVRSSGQGEILKPVKGSNRQPRLASKPLQALSGHG